MQICLGILASSMRVGRRTTKITHSIVIIQMLINVTAVTVMFFTRRRRHNHETIKILFLIHFLGSIYQLTQWIMDTVSGGFFWDVYLIQLFMTNVGLYIKLVGDYINFPAMKNLWNLDNLMRIEVKR